MDHKKNNVFLYRLKDYMATKSVTFLPQLLSPNFIAQLVCIYSRIIFFKCRYTKRKISPNSTILLTMFFCTRMSMHMLIHSICVQQNGVELKCKLWHSGQQLQPQSPPARKFLPSQTEAAVSPIRTA